MIKFRNIFFCLNKINYLLKAEEHNRALIQVSGKSKSNDAGEVTCKTIEVDAPGISRFNGTRTC